MIWVWFDYLWFDFWFKSFLQMICDLYLWFDLWFAHHWGLPIPKMTCPLLMLSYEKVKIKLKISVLEENLNNKRQHFNNNSYNAKKDTNAEQLSEKVSKWNLINYSKRNSKATDIVWRRHPRRQTSDKWLTVSAWRRKKVLNQTQNHFHIFLENIQARVWTSIKRIRHLLIS